MTIEALREINHLEPLLGASVAEGHRHIARLVDDYRSGANRFAGRGEVLLIARAEDEVVLGVCGLNATARPGIGRLRRFYVLPAKRSQGIGAALLEQIVRAARLHFTRLELRTNDPRAAAFYFSHGFQAVQREDATHELEISVFEAVTIPA